MLVIQHHWRRWMAGGGAVELPGPCEVDTPSERAFGWAQEFDWSDSAVRTGRLRLERYAGERWRPLEWRGGPLSIEIGLHKPAGLRSGWDPAFHAPVWLFVLKRGQIGRIRWSGRFGPRPGIAPCFEEHACWIGVGDPEPDMFRDRPLSGDHQQLHLRR